jgi:hypothetical protein
VELIEQNSPPANPASGRIRLFGSNTNLYERTSAGATNRLFENASGGGGGSGINSGSAFPGSPNDNDLFYRSDRDILYYRDGSASLWLSVAEYDLGVGWVEIAAPFAATTTLARWPVRNDHTIYLVKWAITVFCTNTGSAGNNLSIVLARVDSSNTATTLATVSTNGDTASNWIRKDAALGVNLSGTGAVILRSVATETGTVTGAIVTESVVYRLVG